MAVRVRSSASHGGRVGALHCGWGLGNGGVVADAAESLGDCNCISTV